MTRKRHFAKRTDDYTACGKPAAIMCCVELGEQTTCRRCRAAITRANKLKRL